MKPRVLLAGLGETGTELARKLVHNWDLVAVDTDAAAVAGVSRLAGEGVRIDARQGDATSALVLRRAELEGVHAAVACTGSDEVNLEVLRIARELFDIQNRIALMYSLEWEERYRAAGIEVVSQDHACAALLETRVSSGQRVVTSAGTGHGEIIEVEVQPNSSVIGSKLSSLKPKMWLVGAVYRSGRFIVPHGDTILEQGDRVLVIGDPDILPSVATLIRTGESEFPLQYGANVVAVYAPPVDDLLDEVKYLLGSTRARRFEVVGCKGQEALVAGLEARCEADGIPLDRECGVDDRAESLAAAVSRHDLGTLLVPHEPISFLVGLGLGRTRTARIADLMTSPVLVARRSHPYRKVLLGLAELPFPAAAVHLAVDLVRMVGADLHLGVVHQPEMVVGAGLRLEVEERRREVVDLAGMYHVKVETMVMEGNPIEEILKAAAGFDLLVLPFFKGRRSFLTRPDVTMNVMHRARCSVMVMPVDERTR